MYWQGFVKQQFHGGIANANDKLFTKDSVSSDAETEWLTYPIDFAKELGLI